MENLCNRKTSWMPYANKIYIMNEVNNIVTMPNKGIIFFVFMSDILFFKMSNEGGFTIVIHHFVSKHISNRSPHLSKEICPCLVAPVNIKI